MIGRLIWRLRLPVRGLVWCLRREAVYVGDTPCTTVNIGGDPIRLEKGEKVVPLKEAARRWPKS